MNRSRRPRAVAVVGECSVGKSSLSIRFARGCFDLPVRVTLGELLCRDVLIDDQVLSLLICDPCGQEGYVPFSMVFYRHMYGILIAYDVTQRESFAKVTWWINEARQPAPSVPFIIVGNKCDLITERQVSTQEGCDLAAKHGVRFLETSAKDDINVEDAFIELIRVANERSEDNLDTNLEGQIQTEGTYWRCWG